MVHPTLYGSKLVTARKDHRCSDCNAPIARKSKYWRVSGLWDGDFKRYKICEDCMQLFDAIIEQRFGNDDYPYFGGSLAEQAYEFDILTRDQVEVHNRHWKNTTDNKK